MKDLGTFLHEQIKSQRYWRGGISVKDVTSMLLSYEKENKCLIKILKPKGSFKKNMAEEASSDANDT